MSLLLLDSAQYYTDNDLDYLWDYNALVDIDNSVFRAHQTQAIRIGLNEELCKHFTPDDDWVVGCAFYIDQYPTVNPHVIIRVYDSGTHADNSDDFQVGVCVDTAGELQVLRDASNGTVLETTAAGELQINTWYYIELKCTIHNTNGDYEVRVNNVTKLSGSSVDTQHTANAYADRVGFGPNNGGGGTLWYSDIYIMDGGAGENDFWGPIKIETLFPDGAGNHADWTPSAGSNYENVDENPPDEDTTYNWSSAPNDIDTFTFDNVSLSGAIKGVTVGVLQRMTDAGPHTVRPKVRISGTDYNGDGGDVAGTYTYIQYFWDENPDTSVTWISADINAAEFGYERTV